MTAARFSLSTRRSSDSLFATVTDTVSIISGGNIPLMKCRQHPRIFVVDDDPATVLALSELLRRDLGEVLLESATYAPSAIRMLSSTRYDVIITDVVMPRMDGLAVLQAARWLHPEVPVILVTGCAAEREEAALYGGAYAFLQKPIDADRFSSIVRAALGQAELQRRVRQRNQASFLNLLDSIEDASQQLL